MRDHYRLKIGIIQHIPYKFCEESMSCRNYGHSATLNALCYIEDIVSFPRHRIHWEERRRHIKSESLHCLAATGITFLQDKLLASFAFYYLDTRLDLFTLHENPMLSCESSHQ